ncbi:MAG: hypothetical protein PVH00_00305 [Gemmatimonadota bacterium]|jgi:hypothetical protein
MMADAKAIEELERGAYRSRWRDGTLDLFGGLGVLMVGAAWWVDLYWLAPALVPVLMVLWMGVRRRVVEPRIGRVRFSRERREREATGLWGAVGMGVVVLLVLVLLWVFRGERMAVVPREWVRGLPVALLGLMALVASLMTGLVRFAGYALILAGVGAIGVMLGLEPAPQILIGGTIVTLAGGALLFRFLAAHPAREEGAVR